jgi:hypothetical protein
MSILNHLKNNGDFSNDTLTDFKDFYSLNNWNNNDEYDKENEIHVNTIKKIINELRLNINVLICTKEGKLPYLYDENEWVSLYNNVDKEGNYVRLENAEDKVTIYIIYYMKDRVYELYYTNELYPNIDKRKLKYSLGENTELLDDTTNAIINSNTLSDTHIDVLLSNIDIEKEKKNKNTEDMIREAESRLLKYIDLRNKIWETKYLKYKMKYLTLKKLINN